MSSWYKTGTITVTNGSTTVIGSGTQWILNAEVGEALYINEQLYEITNIASDTALTIAPAYLGATAAGQAYVIVPSQSYIRDLAEQASDLVNQYSTIAAFAGQGKFGDGTLAAPGIRYSDDLDTGFFRSAANEVTFVAGGVAQFKYGTGGITFTNVPSITGDLSIADKIVHTGDTNTAIRFPAADTVTVETNGAERVRVESSGNLLVGKTAQSLGTDGIELRPGGLIAGTGNDTHTLYLNRRVGDGAVSIFASRGVNVGAIAVTTTHSAYNVSSAQTGMVGDSSSANVIKFQTNSNERLRIDSSGNVGIGTSSPSARLEVSADARIHGATVGRGAGAIITNTAVGNNALSSNTTGSFNTANGRLALQNNTEGTQNTANGHSALQSNTTGSFNTANGFQALQSNTTGSDNTATGLNALLSNTTGSNNIAIGLNAGRSTSPRTITTQSNEICIGNNSHTGAFIKIAFTVTSDARDKAAFAPIPHGLDFVNALLPTEYQFKAGGRDGVADGHRRYGFLAHEVLAAEGENPVIINDDDPDSLKMTSDYLIPVLVNAMKELTEQVNTLKAKVATLKGN